MPMGRERLRTAGQCEITFNKGLVTVSALMKHAEWEADDLGGDNVCGH